MRLKTWHCLVLLTLVSLVAYYPTLHAGYNSVDDLEMINAVDQIGPLDIPQLIFPHGTAYYYRPLIIFSYMFDRDVWGALPSFMHLENILLHLCCALLVFAITRRLLPLWGDKSLGLALLAGLFFAVHPLTTESVCWISGRTDLLMTVFLLLAVRLTLVALSSESILAGLAGGLALLLASLAKEVAVFVLPGLLWLIFVYPGQGSLLDRLRSRWPTLLMPMAGTGGYFLLRYFASARDSGVNTALKGVVAGGDYDYLNKARVALKVYGFYFKKLLIPWPLNFGIVEISGWYVLVGVLLGVVLIYLAWRADVVGAFGWMAFFVLSPALLVVFGKMTWTPLAERYLYTSVALIAPLVAFLVVRMGKSFKVNRSLPRDLALTALLLVFFGTTLHRAWIWQDNLRLYQDTVAMSPDFIPAKNELASAFMNRGRLAEAQSILRGIEANGSVAGYINDDMNLALILLSREDPDGAMAILRPLLDKNPKKYYDLLQLMIRTNDQRLGKVVDAAAKEAIHRENLGWLLEQQGLRPQPFTLYRIGKRYLALGDNVRALESFEQAYAQTPGDAYYREPAAKFIRQLQEP